MLVVCSYLVLFCYAPQSIYLSLIFSSNTIYGMPLNNKIIHGRNLNSPDSPSLGHERNAHAYISFKMAKTICYQNKLFYTLKVMQPPIQASKNSQFEYKRGIGNCKHVVWTRSRSDPFYKLFKTLSEYSVLKSTFTIGATKHCTEKGKEEDEKNVEKGKPPSFVGEQGRFFQGDIVLPSSTRGAIDPTFDFLDIWPNGILYYDFAPSFDSNSRKIVVDVCMSMISNLTCIQFVHGVSPDGSFIEFVQDDPDSCFAYIGKKGGRQEINLPPLCITDIGTGIHEIVHAIGFFHEQSRDDRDDYITLHEENIDPKQMLAMFAYFKPIDYISGVLNSIGSFYDYTSIMHYPTWGFALDGPDGNPLPTFEPTKLFLMPWVTVDSIGQRQSLSYADIYQIQRLYGCCRITRRSNNTSWRSIASKNDDLLSLTLSKKKKSRFGRSVNSKHAKFPFFFAHSMCRYYSHFLQSNITPGRFENSWKKPSTNVETFPAENIIWDKCSSGDSSCKKFFLENQNKSHDNENKKKDPGEFGNHLQGDLLNDPRDFFEKENFTGLDADWLWPSGIINYRFENHVASFDRTKIIHAMDEIQKTTCIEFTERDESWADAYLLISTDQEGCFANVGFNASRIEHKLNLNSDGCLELGSAVAVHELLHVIGLQHEHLKPNRDHFVKINLDNIKPERRNEFTPLTKEHLWIAAWPLRLDSIMMPPINFHARSSDLVTIQPLQNVTNFKIGQRLEMTPQDIAQVMTLYNCCEKG